MGYYIRFIATDAEELHLATLEAALRDVDPAYSIKNVTRPSSEFGDLFHGEELYGQIEVNQPADPEELEELREDVTEAEGTRKQREKVLKCLREARLVVAVQVLWQGRSADATLDKLQPLWQWLAGNRQGLLYADEEGFYDESGLILGV
jgi:hypothetical protein